MSSTPSETRAQRADRLRKPIQDLASQSSWRQAAEVVGLSVGALRNLAAGGVPHESTLQAFEAWAERAGILPHTTGRDSTNGRPIWKDAAIIGATIREIRKRADMSQQELAEYLGMPASQAEVSRWERGHSKPVYETLAAIAHLAGEPVDIFQVGGELGEDWGRGRQLDEWQAARETHEATQALAEVQETTRFLEGVAPAGEEKEMKLAVLEMVKRMILRVEPRLPDWWYRLRGMVEDGAI